MESQFQFIQDPYLGELSNYIRQRREYVHLRASTQVRS